MSPIDPEKPEGPVMIPAPRRKSRPNIPWQIKQEIWHMPCAVCESIGDALIDHIIPFSKGGSSERENLQPLCGRCNGLKQNRLSNYQIAVIRSREIGRQLPLLKGSAQ